MENLQFTETRSGNHYFTATLAGREIKSVAVWLKKDAEGFARSLARSLATGQNHAERLASNGKWVVDLYSPRYVVVAHSTFATREEAFAFLSDIKKLAQ